MLREDPQYAKALGDRIIKNTYRTLMTRGQKGCYVYFVDAETGRYFEERIGKRQSAIVPYDNALPLLSVPLASEPPSSSSSPPPHALASRVRTNRAASSRRRRWVMPRSVAENYASRVAPSRVKSLLLTAAG